MSGLVKLAVRILGLAVRITGMVIVAPVVACIAAAIIIPEVIKEWEALQNPSPWRAAEACYPRQLSGQPATSTDQRFDPE